MTIAHLRRFTQNVLESDNVVPVVLEFQQPPVAVYKRFNPQADETQYQAELSKSHREFIERLASLGMEIQMGQSAVVEASPQGANHVNVPHDFTYVFNGVGVLMPGRFVATVAGMAEVRAISLNRERVYIQLDKSVPFSGGPQVWQRSDAAGRAIKGEGVTVAVIDTGIDWTHPGFGGFKDVPNEKVVHAASYTGEYPLDNFGHGSHVAGIIAGDADYKGTPRGDAMLNGLAPKARLMGYKVLTAAGSGSATNIILAMEDAVKRGAHVINLSLGDMFGDPYSPESSAANNAMKAGVVVCVAAGNSGPTRDSIGAPGAAHDVITVGASTDDGVTALMAEVEIEGAGQHEIEMRLMDGSVPLPSPAVEVAFVSCGMGLKPKDFPKQVKGRIALIQRGEITFLEKALNAEKAGALAAVIYNNREGNFFGTLGEEAKMPTIPVVAISMENGDILLKAVGEKNQSKAKLKLRPDEVPQPYQLAEFSSRGPNNDGWIKPEITAPGVNINSSTITQAPMPGGGMPDPSGYISASGTSMATPHVAGAAALLRQAHPDWTSQQIKAALVNTARFMEGQGDVMDQGNGAMDLVRALDCKAILVTASDPASPTCSFGRVAHEGAVKKVSQALTIQNLVAGGEAAPLSLHVAMLGGLPQGLTAELSVTSVDHGASFDLSMTADGAVLKDGVYCGFVVAEAAWGTLRLPFYYEAAKEPRVAPPDPQQNQQPVVPIERRRLRGMACS